MRLLLDTNVVVAGLLWNGAPRKLLDRAIDDESIELFSSPVPIDELTHTLGYAKFTKRIIQSRTSVTNLVTHYQALVRLVSPTD
ncbi:MAG TPA: putative toxin-antitoxin system toxin component, PIN family, partial [Rhodocyclaceae bacterium]|nr:putative toxin-antitoxin system toxin component, PIN family [Rhodocyclaceae bacterium]